MTPSNVLGVDVPEVKILLDVEDGWRDFGTT
jgi:hypothetical protein